MNGPTDWSRREDFFDDPDAPDQPIVVASPVAAERRGGESQRRQAVLDARRAK